ncbi:MAG: hypothetical protein MZV65_25150 [Chromatiales bacterium]|nr:hypothetical protein [Chromatiales bacterium]
MREYDLAARDDSAFLMTHPDNNDDISETGLKPLMVEAISDAALLHEGLSPRPVRGAWPPWPAVSVWSFARSCPAPGRLRLTDIGQPLRRLADTDLFEWQGAAGAAALALSAGMARRWWPRMYGIRSLQLSLAD